MKLRNKLIMVYKTGSVATRSAQLEGIHREPAYGRMSSVFPFALLNLSAVAVLVPKLGTYFRS